MSIATQKSNELSKARLSKIEDRISKARWRLMKRSPFFGALVIHMEMVSKPNIQTTAVNKKGQFLYNPFFVESLTMEVLIFCVAHEVMHLAMNFFARCGNRNPQLFNIAHDYVINLMLKDEGFELWEHAIVDEKYRDMSAEEVYRLLKDEQEQQQQQQDSGDDSGEGEENDDSSGGGSDNREDSQEEDDSNDANSNGESEDEDDDSNEESSSGSQEDKDESDDNDSNTSSNDSEDSKNSSQDESESKPEKGMGHGGGCCDFDDVDIDAHEEQRQEEKWKRRLVQAAQIGTMPGAMKMYLDELLHPQLPWRELLRTAFSNAVLRTEYGYRRPSRRDTRDMFFSSIQPDKGVPTIACDTSGSMTHEFIVQAVTEVIEVLDELNLPLRMISVDAAIHVDAEVTSAEEVAESIQGGGGTNFDKVFERLEGEEVSVLVFFTDLWVHLPDIVPTYPVIWVCPPHNGSNDGRTFPNGLPFGEVITINPSQVK